MKVSYLVVMFVLITIFLITIISAEVQTLGTVKQNDCIALKQSYWNSTYTNITSVQYPNKTSIQVNYAMTRDNFGNYNYTFCDTHVLEQYFITTTTDVDGVPTNVVYDFLVTPDGTKVSTVQISVYIFFLLLCLALTFFSFVLAKKESVTKDQVKGKDLYEMKKRNEFYYYLHLMKQKMWIVGIFGIYLSVLLFIGVLTQVVYLLGLGDLSSILQNFSLILLWGLVPFTIFWLVYLIIVFYKMTADTMLWQLGNIARSSQ